jgi:hypothetical protein
MMVSSNLATAMLKLVATDTLSALVEKLIVGNLVSRRYQPPSIPVLDLKPEQLIAWSLHVPDITKLLAAPGLLRLYMEPAILSLAAKIETDLAGACGGFPFGESLVGASGQTKFVVAGIGAYGAMRELPKFSLYRSAADAGLRYMLDGPVGYVDGSFVVLSRFLPDNEAVSFTSDAMRIIMRRPDSDADFAEYSETGNFGLLVESAFDPYSLGQTYTIKLAYGIASGSGHGIRLQSTRGAK